MLKVFTLKNGIQVATYSLPNLRSVALDLAVKAGSLFETKKNCGISHFMEHLLLQGTPTFPDGESLSNFIEKLAGYHNAYTQPQSIRVFLNSPAVYMEEILRVGQEVFFQSLFKEQSIERERSSIIEELKQRQDDLGHKLSKFYTSVRYKKGHPLALTAEDDIPVISKLTKKDLISWWEKYFTTKNTFLVLVGGFKDSEAERLIKKYFESSSSQRKTLSFPELSNSDFSTKAVLIRNDNQLRSCYADISFPSIGSKQSIKTRTAQVLIRAILGGLSTSRLYRLLRYRKGLVYSVSAGIASYQDFGSFFISTEVAKEKLEEVVDLIFKELDQFVKFGPTEDELDLAKNYHINRSLMTWDHPGGIAEWIRSDLMWEEKVYSPEEYGEIIQSVDMKDVMDFMRQSWDFKKLNLVIQGPIENNKVNIARFEDLIPELE